MNFDRKSSPSRRPGAHPKLFISYRRRFDHGSARLLTEKLTRAFGDGAVFWDLDDIEPGDAFPDTIREALEECDVFLLLVSPGWIESAERLHDPDDFVRREVAAALARPILFIPLLLGGARIPKADELPEEVRGLAFRQALELSDDRWDYDVERLLKLIRARTGLSEPSSFFAKTVAALRSFVGTWPGKAAAAAVVLLAAGAGVRYAILHELFYRDFDGCAGNHSPDMLGATAILELGAYDLSLTQPDQYHIVQATTGRPGGFPILLRLKESGQDLGAVVVRYFKEGETFKIEKVLEPPCAVVQSGRVLANWERFPMRLGGRDYYLRLGDHNDSSLRVSFTPAAGGAPTPGK